MEKVLSGQTNLEISYEGTACTIKHVDSGDTVTEDNYNDRGRNLTMAVAVIDCKIRTRYAEHLEGRIAKLEAQLQAAEEAHALKIREVAGLEAESVAILRAGNYLAELVENRAQQLCDAGFARMTVRLMLKNVHRWTAATKKSGTLEAQLPRWSVVADDGWPTVADEAKWYCTVDNRGALRQLRWYDGPPALNGWKQVERYIRVSDLEKLPGGPS